MAIGAAVGILLVVVRPSFDTDYLLRNPLEIGLTVVGVYYLAILLHELGHFAGGIWAGFAFRQFAVGPLVLIQETGGLRLRWVPARLLGGGHVMMAPESTDRLRPRYLQFMTGGPVVTALLFVIPLALPWSLFTRCLFGMNLLIAASSWVPYTINGRSTDAKVLLGLGRPGPQADRLATILYLLAIDGGGTAPRDWPSESLSALERDGGNSAHREIGLMFVYFRAMDDGDPARIAGALERVLALGHRMNPDSRRAFFAEAAFVQGIFRKDATLARAWLEDARKVKGTLPKDDWESAALAGIACAEGEAELACAELRRAIAMLDRQPGNSGSVAACRGRLAELLSEGGKRGR